MAVHERGHSERKTGRTVAQCRASLNDSGAPESPGRESRPTRCYAASVADLDGVATDTGRDQMQHGGLKEGGVHTELQRQPPAEAGAEPVEHVPQEGRGLLGIVDVARTARWARSG